MALILLLKSHVDTYTKHNGTVVSAYDDKRPIYAKPHPSGKHRHGDPVFFPHPDPKKNGKNALGAYVGHSEDGKQSVVRHDQGGGQMYAVDHDSVKYARGVPRSPSKGVGESFEDVKMRAMEEAEKATVEKHGSMAG